MALVCLAMLCMSSTETTSIDTRPYVRVVFGYNEINVHAGHPFDLVIFFKNTYRLFVYREDNAALQEITLEGEEINDPNERVRYHSVVINEYDYTVRYYIIAVSEDGSYMDTHITLHTYQYIEP